jgi:hypothetical protein
MADEPEGGAQDQDAGEPVEALRDFDEQVSSDFVQRVGRRIHRRNATAHVIDFSWRTPGMVLLELSKMLRQVFSAMGEGKGPGK